MTEFLTNMTPWHWAALALILLSIEMITGTFDFIWIGLAAGIAALFAWLAPDAMNSWQVQCVVFAVTAIALVIMGRTAFSGLRNPPSSHPNLNDRIGKMVGHTAVVTSEFIGGEGRVRVGDTEWAAESADGVPHIQGAQVVITGGAGSMVKVKAELGD